MKGYVGRRDFDEVKVYVVTEKTAGGLDREPLKHLVLHSPTGMEWGYLGSGPADLALSILADWFGESPTEKELRMGSMEIPDDALLAAKTTDQMDQLWSRSRIWCVHYHQHFKEAFIGKMPKEGWSLEGRVISAWVEDQERKGGRP
jgi:hypothetical protein